MNAQQNAFLRMVVPAAQAAQRQWAVPASVTIAQAILESSNELGWGQSQLARECNNYFGIKATNLQQPNSYVAFETHEYVNGHLVTREADFVRYESIAESFNDHARLLACAVRYRPAMRATARPLLFACKLGPCGYSTNPAYGDLLCQLISRYDLQQYDVPPAGPSHQAAA